MPPNRHAIFDSERICERDSGVTPLTFRHFCGKPKIMAMDELEGIGKLHPTGESLSMPLPQASSTIEESKHVPEGIVHANPVDEAELEASFRKKLKSELVKAEELPTEEVSFASSGLSTSSKILVAIFLFGILAFASILGVLLPSSKERDETPLTTEQVQPSRLDYLRNLLLPLSDAIANVTSPQYRALNWLATEDELQLDVMDPSNEWDVIERYVMMVLFYSTNGPNSWSDRLLFGSNYTTCEWPNIGQNEDNLITFNEVDCDENNRIIKLRLGTYS